LAKVREAHRQEERLAKTGRAFRGCRRYRVLTKFDGEAFDRQLQDVMEARSDGMLSAFRAEFSLDVDEIELAAVRLGL
jgi:hypothetical protein